MPNTREKLIELVKQGYNKYFNPNWALDFFAIIADHLIANDVVPVVRCAKCRLAKTICNDYVCCLTGMPVNADGFCSLGERKDNERKAD